MYHQAMKAITAPAQALEELILVHAGPDSPDEIKTEEIKKLAGQIRTGLIKAKATSRIQFPVREQQLAMDRLDECEMLAESGAFVGARQALALVLLWAGKGITQDRGKAAISR